MNRCCRSRQDISIALEFPLHLFGMESLWLCFIIFSPPFVNRLRFNQTLKMAQMHVSVANTCGTGNVTSPSNNFMSDVSAIDGSQFLLSSGALGLEILYDSIRQVYPQQPNPLQVTAFIKYWWVWKIWWFTWNELQPVARRPIYLLKIWQQMKFCFLGLVDQTL